jgi:hypothetical protein
MQRKAELSRGIQGKKRDAAEQSRMLQRIPGSNREKQIHPGQCRDAQEDTESTATARCGIV